MTRHLQLEHTLNYGRIRRGPMAADEIERHFTQIHNALFRDRRISFKAKGVFGLISTHRNGYGITPESIANDGKDGIAAVRSALQELERYGYLERTQERRLDGTMGPTTYYITDMPRSEPHIDFQPAALTSGNAEIRRSEPGIDFPHAAEPRAVNRTHKKTTSKNTSGKKTLPPRLPRQQAAQPTAAPVERENLAAPQNHNPVSQIDNHIDNDDQAEQIAAAWTAARGGRRVSSAEREVAASAVELLADGWPLDELLALAQDMAAKYPTGRNLARHADHWQPPKAAAVQSLSASAAELPRWCRDIDCDPDTRWRLTTDDRGFQHTGPCPECHPDHARQEAA